MYCELGRILKGSPSRRPTRQPRLLAIFGSTCHLAVATAAAEEIEKNLIFAFCLFTLNHEELDKLEKFCKTKLEAYSVLKNCIKLASLK